MGCHGDVPEKIISSLGEHDWDTQKIIELEADASYCVEKNAARYICYGNKNKSYRETVIQKTCLQFQDPSTRKRAQDNCFLCCFQLILDSLY